jgi:chromosome segregation ATPase
VEAISWVLEGVSFKNDRSLIRSCASLKSLAAPKEERMFVEVEFAHTNGYEILRLKQTWAGGKVTREARHFDELNAGFSLIDDKEGIISCLAHFAVPINTVERLIVKQSDSAIAHNEPTALLKYLERIIGTDKIDELSRKHREEVSQLRRKQLKALDSVHKTREALHTTQQEIDDISTLHTEHNQNELALKYICRAVLELRAVQRTAAIGQLQQNKQETEMCETEKSSLREAQVKLAATSKELETGLTLCGSSAACQRDDLTRLKRKLTAARGYAEKDRADMERIRSKLTRLNQILGKHKKKMASQTTLRRRTNVLIETTSEEIAALETLVETNLQNKHDDNISKSTIGQIVADIVAAELGDGVLLGLAETAASEALSELSVHHRDIETLNEDWKAKQQLLVTLSAEIETISHKRSIQQEHLVQLQNDVNIVSRSLAAKVAELDCLRRNKCFGTNSFLTRCSKIISIKDSHEVIGMLCDCVEPKNFHTHGTCLQAIFGTALTRVMIVKERTDAVRLALRCRQNGCSGIGIDIVSEIKPPNISRISAQRHPCVFVALDCVNLKNREAGPAIHRRLAGWMIFEGSSREAAEYLHKLNRHNNFVSLEGCIFSKDGDIKAVLESKPNPSAWPTTQLLASPSGNQRETFQDTIQKLQTKAEDLAAKLTTLQVRVRESQFETDHLNQLTTEKLTSFEEIKTSATRIAGDLDHLRLMCSKWEHSHQLALQRLADRHGKKNVLKMKLLSSAIEDADGLHTNNTENGLLSIIDQLVEKQLKVALTDAQCRYPKI